MPDICMLLYGKTKVKVKTSYIIVAIYLESTAIHQCPQLIFVILLTQEIRVEQLLALMCMLIDWDGFKRIRKKITLS